MEDTVVKEEILDYIKLEHSPTTIITTTGSATPRKNTTSSQISNPPIEYIDLSSSDSESSDDSDDEQLGLDPSGKRSRVSENGDSNKKQRLDDLGFVLPLGFLDPLPPEETVPPPLPLPEPVPVQVQAPVRRCQSTAAAVVRGAKQFWKAGDYDDSVNAGAVSVHTSVGMDHVRVHPKFLHSNATSHKWALGAFAELLDNSLDEVCSGATYVNIDMLENKKDGSRMLLIEDNGGGMDPDKMRQCMSLGYSAKSKLANVIGQYGNGFKTSTMRLGADVIVFSRCCGKDSKSPTQSIGLLSYTFLKSTGKEDIVVPMLDYEKGEGGWNKLMRSSPDDWNRNAETIVQWSPYSSEAELLDQFNVLSYHGTRIIIYNLWEDDQGQLELDFCADRHDIQIRGGNRDEKKIEMARQFPNSRHFLTYRHSLRSYASILYLRLPPAFRIVLRGKDVEQHNLVNDMMLTEEVTYRPQPGADGVPKDANMVAVVTMGFVKDAEKHIDVQGFNVYHKNRLIKPFWRVWNPAGSDGRGVIGVLEANFVVPAHDKQGFERTIVLQRLEQRLVQMQKTYWRTQCHRIGYSFRGSKKLLHESSPEHFPHLSRHSDKATPSDMRDPEYTPHSSRHTPSGMKDPKHGTGHLNGKAGNGKQNSTKYGNKSFTSGPASSIPDDDSDCEIQMTPPVIIKNGSGHEASTTQKSFKRNSSHLSQSSSRNSDNGDVQLDHASNGNLGRIFTRSQLKAVDGACNGGAHASVVNSSDLNSLEAENRKLEDRIKELEESFGRNLELEREKIRSLEALVNDRSSQGSEGSSLIQLKMENSELKDSVKKMEEDFLRDLEFERERCRSLEAQLKESEAKMEQMNKEQEALIDIFAEERNRRDNEEVNLRKKLKDASSTIQTLLDKVRMLEKMKSTTFKEEPLATQ